MYEYLAGKRVLLTGHSGFCGSWLSLCLRKFGAEVFGLSLAPNTEPNLHDGLAIWDNPEDGFGDIRESGRVAQRIQEVQPDLVFHLAAQPLVRYSYQNPLETYQTNVLGTAEVMEAIRHSETVKAAVIVTTDKVYHNNEWVHPYRETDRLGGKDPYSASKAASEIVIQSYIDTMLDSEKVQIGTARGGNIIGGGDWSADRLIPDIVRSIQTGSVLEIRNPAATRPWQHVLALCHGYIHLCEGLIKDADRAAGAWNFGPMIDDGITTMQCVEIFTDVWKKPEIEITGSPLHEAQRLALDCTKARLTLGWQPAWDANRAIAETAEWFRRFDAGESMISLCEEQTDKYFADLA